jgi:hypothetical protein
VILSDAGTPARKAAQGAGKSARITSSPRLPTLMFLHKFRRTFIAMLWGWVVCNLVTCSALVLWILCSEGSIYSKLQYLVLYALLSVLYSGIVITSAWLIVLLPTDVLVSDGSDLRKPRNAAACGAAGGFTSVILIKIAIWVTTVNEANTMTEDLEWLFAFGFLAAITGLTAALHVVLKHPRSTV